MYTYDDNGNMITDLNKDLTINQYNYLNLPQQININNDGGTHNINYLYDAAGIKLRKQTKIDYAVVKTMDYFGSFVYENNELKYILTAEGRVMINSNGTFEYQYFLKDHLGNTRVTFNENGDVIQDDAYYPFGMQMNGLSYETGEDYKNKYLYNGKELQDDFGLDWYDYGARFYDAEIGRFTSVDSHAENYLSWTPYNYVANNPMIFTDPTGMDWYEDKKGNTMWKKGSADVDGYKNLGANYTQSIGNGVSISYTQNDATSITFKGAENSSWESQIINGTSCKTASDKIIANEGSGTTREGEIVMTIANTNGRTGDATSYAQDGINRLYQTLENGKAVEVGVDYKKGNASENGDNQTDHFIVVASKTETLNNGSVTGKTYNFFDPRTAYGHNSIVNYGTSSSNTISVNNNNKLTGVYNHGGSYFNYTVTTVRKTN